MTPAVQPVIGIIDYGMGNRRSVEKAVAHLGARAELTSDHATLKRAEALILPGVGAFPRGIQSLRGLGLDALICELVSEGVPLLGICLGMQLLFESSSELGESEGLGLIGGSVAPLEPGGQRIPHIGWSEVRFDRPSALTEPLSTNGTPFYHVHSYVARPTQADDVIGTAEYGERFASIVSHGNVYGVQFHPEKSSTDGLKLLGGFLRLAGARTQRPSQPVGVRR